MANFDNTPLRQDVGYACIVSLSIFHQWRMRPGFTLKGLFTAFDVLVVLTGIAVLYNALKAS